MTCFVDSIETRMSFPTNSQKVENGSMSTKVLFRYWKKETKIDVDY